MVSDLDPSKKTIYSRTWRRPLKLLVVSRMDRFARAISTITRYVEVGRDLGHEVAVFGEQISEPSVPCSLDVESFDYAIFVIYDASDFPDLPHLARLLDHMPKERRIIIDCLGRYNDTIRVEHDFNHLERLDGHQGWEWVEGFQAVSDTILQPALSPRREDVTSFLFHAYDPAALAHVGRSPAEAAKAWEGSNGEPKRYGIVYVGNNWQRWTQVQPFLESVAPLRDKLGPICLAGWDWNERPAWAVEHGLQGADVDPELLEQLGVETRWAIPFDEVVDFVGQSRFCPVFHRPLFNELGMVTNRTFETFCADTIPLLMLPEDFVQQIYGDAALALVPGEDVAGRIEEMMRRPEDYWNAVFETREHLATYHTHEQRLKELLGLLPT